MSSDEKNPSARPSTHFRGAVVGTFCDDAQSVWHSSLTMALRRRLGTKLSGYCDLDPSKSKYPAVEVLVRNYYAFNGFWGPLP